MPRKTISKHAKRTAAAQSSGTSRALKCCALVESFFQKIHIAQSGRLPRKESSSSRSSSQDPGPKAQAAERSQCRDRATLAERSRGRPINNLLSKPIRRRTAASETSRQTPPPQAQVTQRLPASRSPRMLPRPQRINSFTIH